MQSGTVSAMPRAKRDESQTLRALLRMRELLLRGEFRPGERIREIPLAARLHVSRTPLRLVLHRLEEEGLVAARPTGGFVASEFSMRDIYDGIEIRGVLEGCAAKLAAERVTQARRARQDPAVPGRIDRLDPELDVGHRLAGEIHRAQCPLPRAAGRPGAQPDDPPRRRSRRRAAVCRTERLPAWATRRRKKAARSSRCRRFTIAPSSTRSPTRNRRAPRRWRASTRAWRGRAWRSSCATGICSRRCRGASLIRFPELAEREPLEKEA